MLLKAAEDVGPAELQDDIDKVFRALFKGPARGFGEDLEANPPLPEATAEGPSEA